MTDRLWRVLHLPPGAWFIPKEIKLEGDWLLWKPSPEPPPSETPPIRVATAPPGLLKKFCALAAASDKSIVSFASKWGVLFLCKHNLPVRHFVTQCAGINDLPTLRQYYDRGSAPPCSLQRLPHMPEWYAEPLTGWRQLATQAQEFLSRAAKRAIGALNDPHEWYNLARNVDMWLAWGDVRPQIQPWGKNDKVTLEPGSGLLGALAIQLAAAVTRSGGFAVCVDCGDLYQPTRKPQTGRRTFCKKCRDTGAHARFAMRDYLRRKRERQESNQGADND